MCSSSRVTSGSGGHLSRTGLKALKADFPELRERIAIRLPDELSRRLGQSIAAASLPEI
jgi:hypothetical protein